MTPAAPVVLVTGGAQRIGAAIVQQFHQHGFNVVIHCRRSVNVAETLAGQLRAQRPGSASVVTADFAAPTLATRDTQGLYESIAGLADDALRCYGRLDVLVNNASAFYPTPLSELTPAHWSELMSSNAQAPLFLSQALAGELRQRSGSIINLTDMNVDRGMAGFSAYTMAKGALQAMTRSLARELAPQVRVNAVSPGAIIWPDHASDPVEDADAQARLLAEIPLGRLGQPADIARTVYFLAWQASYITGETIRVDGGRRLSAVVTP